MSTLRRKRKIEFKSRVNLEDEYFYRVVNPRCGQGLISTFECLYGLKSTYGLESYIQEVILNTMLNMLKLTCVNKNDFEINYHFYIVDCFDVIS